ncbi:MAG: hypothetical protein K2M94_05375 [Paramuribaculum sp.]|nr:hypothetical protein [Paramuribaculum sp.]
MKKSLILLLTLITFGTCIISAQEPVVSILTKIANQGSYVTGYDKEFKLIDNRSNLTWTVRNFNNNNSAWDNIRCGSKSSATTATITTDFVIATPISKVDVEVSRYKTGSTNRMTSMALLVSPNADMSNSTSYSADISGLPITTGTPVIISIPVTAPAENMYYQLSVDMPKVSSEGVFSVNSLSYYPEVKEPEVGVHDGTLDFTEKQSVIDAYAGDGTIEPGGEYSESGTNNLNGATFTVGEVCVSLSKAEGTITPRWWESKTISPELRLNPDNVMTFEVIKQGCRLLEVKFLQGNATTSYYDALEASATTNVGETALKDKTWSASDDEVVDRLTLVFSDYCRCGSIRITYFDENEGMSGIETISVNVGNEIEPVEYYNLQGVKVNQGNIAPGIYIMRQGSKITKVILN